MKNLILSAAFLLLGTSSSFAADDAAAASSNDTATMKHCRSMMKDGKMMEGMPKQMTDKCQALMKEDNMKGMKMDGMSSDTNKPRDMKDDSK